MSALSIRGGIPRFYGGVATTTLGEIPFTDGITNHLLFRNLGAVAIELAFNKHDAEAGNFWTVANATSIEIPAEVGGLWLKSASSTSAWEALALIRRG